MGFKRAILNRLQISNQNNTLIADMEGNNENPNGDNDGNRKHTDFSIDKILSDDKPKISAVSPNWLLHMNNEYAYWNRRIYPSITSMRPFVPATPILSTTQYEIMNLSLRMYDQQINSNSNCVERMRTSSAFAWPNPSALRIYDAQHITNNNTVISGNSSNNNTKYSIYEDISLSKQSSQMCATTVVKTEPLNVSNASNSACSVCNKVFENAHILEMHERTHKSPRYKCDDCGKGFSQLRNYKYHVSVHKGTKEFAAKCPECDKLFNDKGYLSSHLKIHRNKKEYVCPHCPKSFNQRVAFNMHVRIHSGVKPHKCAECGKCFSRKMLLKQHLRTHSGEKPYQCSICLKTFADRSNMTLHQRLHSGIKPFACTICPKAFTKKHHLKTHLNYHIGCKPYICPHPNCGKTFTQSSNMRTHSRKCEFKPPE